MAQLIQAKSRLLLIQLFEFVVEVHVELRPACHMVVESVALGLQQLGVLVTVLDMRRSKTNYMQLNGQVRPLTLADRVN